MSFLARCIQGNLHYHCLHTAFIHKRLGPWTGLDRKALAAILGIPNFSCQVKETRSYRSEEELQSGFHLLLELSRSVLYSCKQMVYQLLSSLLYKTCSLWMQNSCASYRESSSASPLMDVIYRYVHRSSSLRHLKLLVRTGLPPYSVLQCKKAQCWLPYFIINDRWSCCSCIIMDLDCRLDHAILYRLNVYTWQSNLSISVCPILTKRI